jgi:hypothetical protein
MTKCSYPIGSYIHINIEKLAALTDEQIKELCVISSRHERRALLAICKKLKRKIT